MLPFNGCSFMKPTHVHLIHLKIRFSFNSTFFGVNKKTLFLFILDFAFVNEKCSNHALLNGIKIFNDV
jgi:hypothetical protein